MQMRWLLTLLLVTTATGTLLAQNNRAVDMYYHRSHGEYRIGHRNIITLYKQLDGYIVLHQDTLHGLIQLSKTTLYFDQYMPNDQLKPYVIKLKDTALSTIMMYNYDMKPLCIKRVQPGDKKMHRVVHSGKLNIYDDWMKYIYKPSDIDPYLLVVENNGEVDELGSFTKGTTIRDLIGYVNDIYGLKLDPKNITWSQLMRTIDELD